MHIIILGTNAPGGINSVIEGYINDGLYDGFKTSRIISHSGKGKARDLLLFFSAILQLLLLLILKRNVIVHSHMSMNGSFWRKSCFMWITKLLGGKYIYHLHGSEFKVFYSKLSKIGRAYMRHTFDVADSFIVLSESWAEFVKKISSAKVVVVNNYVDVAFLPLVRKSNDILFLGAFIKRKGIYDLLEAFSLLNNENKYVLHLCGGGEDENVRQHIHALGLDKAVLLYGWVDSEQKAKLLNTCTVLILPSYNEGLPMVVIEAMGSRIPLITTPVGGIPDVIAHGESCLFVAPGQVNEIAYSLRQYLQDKQLRDKLTEAAYSIYVEKFNSAVIFPKLLKIYSDIRN